MIEEVARLYGYDQIPSTVPVGVLALDSQRSASTLVRKITAGAMLAAGLDEVITYSFIGDNALARLNIPEDNPLRQAVPIQNPLREEQGILRPLLLPCLMEALNTNYKRKQTSAGLFELGIIFRPAGADALPDERLHLGIVVCGETDRGWQEPSLERDFFSVKGIAESLFELLGIDGASFEPWTEAPILHPGRAARILVEDVEAGFLGELHPDVLENYELSSRTVVCELDLAVLYPLARLQAIARPLPRYPGSARDLAIIVPRDVPAGKVRTIISEAGGELLRECRLFNVYQGSQVPEGCRSLAYSLLFQSLDRTLTDEEVAQTHSHILKALATRVGARLRQ